MSYKIYNPKEIKKGVKIRRILIAGVLAGTVSILAFLEGVGLYNHINNKRSLERNKNKSSTSSISTESDKKVSSTSTDPLFILEDDEYVETDITDTHISIDSDSLKEFTDYVDSLEIDYPYSELFQIEDALQSRNNYQEINHHSIDIRNSKGYFDIDELVKNIYENNKVYYEELGSMQAFYENMTSSEIREICKTILETIKLEEEKVPIDKDRLSCFLGNLKMFKKSGVAMASVSKDGVLSVNPTMLQFGEVIAGTGNNDKNVLIHEVVHMIQSSCQEKEESYKIGTSYKDTSLDINPLYHSWLVESSAEKERINLTGDKNIIYDAQIGYENSLEYVLALKDSYAIGEIETLNSTQDDDTFYSLFNSTKEEIIKLLYSIEIIEAEPEEFESQYSRYFNEELTDEKLLEIKRVLKGSLSATLAKEFYRNLAEKVQTEKMTLEDAFFLIKIFESDIFGHIRYDNEEKRDLGKLYFEIYEDLQSKFFSSITLDDLSYDEIMSYYLEYSSKIIYNGQKRDNYSLVWLPEEKREFVKLCKDNVYSKTVVSPHVILNELNEKSFS